LVLLVVAPLSVVLARRFGTKPVVAGGMLCIAVALGLLSRTTATTTYPDLVPAFILLGIGAGLAMAPSTESVMGSLPLAQAGVGSATSDTALQVGGALGVGVLGTLLNLRYQSMLTPLLAHHAIPAQVSSVILGSLGGALAVAGHVGGPTGAALSAASRHAFISGMDLGLLVASLVVGVAGVVVLVVLPNRGAVEAAAGSGDPQPVGASRT